MASGDDASRRLASRLVDEAIEREQAAHRLRAHEDADAIRAEARRLARERGISIRTSVLGDVLAIVRTDAAIWNETRAVMRRKLTPRD